MSVNKSSNKPLSANAAVEGRSKPKFRIQHAILILRQGKSHPQWREAAWHLMEHAGKDTQLLLEAQRDLIEAANPAPSSRIKPWMMLVLGLGLISMVSVLLWQVISQFKVNC